MNTHSQSDGPLSGVKIADLTSVLLGPFATQILADHGADVIKIEGLDGDTTRDIGPRHSEGMAAVYMHANRNKRSLSIDLKNKDGKAAFVEFLKTVDVFVHNMRPSAVNRLGLSYEEVKKINPGIIYCGAFGFSQDGPYANKPAYDDMIQGVSGIAATQSDLVGRPSYMPTVLADKATGLTVVYAITMALFHKERTGRGQEVKVPMFETMVQFHMLEHIYGEHFIPPQGTAGYPRATSPTRHPYKTKDNKMIGVLPYVDKQWKAFFDLAERPELMQDPRFCSISKRLANIDELYSILSDIIETRTAEEWLSMLDEAGIPAVPINTASDLISDPHLVATNFWHEMEHPTEGRLRFTGIPTQFSQTPGSIRRHPPLLGEHSKEVLIESGVPEDTINNLIKSKAIKTA
ncbi:CaiB/BaiF CoA transferase family protein [Sneathiella glossodoripedis]|uniref:CaiB/BaiF CoA transferase family protein n=1 Tax=Sneathiella glossodoripedis TaxID=418853 RepID=UPI000470C2B0|nr:CoA transferase [Sneathiella glossodoripedis]